MASPAQARPAPDSGPAVPAGAAGDVPVTAEVAFVDEAAAFSPKAISWGTCTEKAFLRKAHAKCGYLTVPLDYAKPKGTKIKLRVARVKHTISAKNYKGVMLTSPTLPGASGLWLATSTLKGARPAKVAKAYDWVGFDPRGTGGSKPLVACGGGGYAVGHNRPDYRMTTTAKENVWLTKAKKYAKTCDRLNGAILDHMKTRDMVNDLESLRKALGKSKISFYGQGYGSYVGEVYSSLHPTRINRMVLDGPQDPARVGYRAMLDQDLTMDASIKLFFTWMAKYDATYHLGTTEAQVESRYYQELDALDVKAAAGKIGSDELTDVFGAVVYYKGNYPYVAKAFADWVNDGDSSQLQDLYDYWFGAGPVADRFISGYLANMCTDAAWPAAWATWRTDLAAANAVAPFMAYGNAAIYTPCHYWGPKPGKPVTVNGAKVPAALLIAETRDGINPYAGALAVRSLFPKSRLLEGVGGTSSENSMTATSCVENAIANYLWAKTLPKRAAGVTSDKKCKPYPAPKPLTAAAGSVGTEEVPARISAMGGPA